MHAGDTQASRERYAPWPVFWIVIVLVSVVTTWIDAESGTISLREASTGIATACIAVAMLVGGQHSRLECWLRRLAAALAVGYLVFWALE